MIKVCKGVYLHFSLGLIFIIAIFSGTFEITVMAFLCGNYRFNLL